ncbi:hypothetical protein LB503_002059 [Fusarium chuoi]|nr:hypothetical protein LB503_002059 [Fusarium chuoi]
MDSYDDFQSTPTGKVSKAKKGKPVHVCSECQKATSVFPPRTPVRMPSMSKAFPSQGSTRKALQTT